MPKAIDLKALVKEYDDLSNWQAIAKERKSEIKKIIVGLQFPAPKEGTNRIETSQFIFELDYPIKRDVDPVMAQTLDKDFKKYKIPVDDLIGWDPKLFVRPYRKLNTQQTKLFDNCVTAKPGSSTLTIITKP